LSTLPEPWGLLGRLYGLDPESAIAVPLEMELTLYRLVVNDPPNQDDFAEIPRGRAEKQGVEEIYRTGLSHFLTVEQATQGKWKDSQMIARVPLKPNKRIHVARTDRHRPGHVDVWLPADVLEDMLLGAIEIVE
jgi:hypothetical protein